MIVCITPIRNSEINKPYLVDTKLLIDLDIKEFLETCTNSTVIIPTLHCFNDFDSIEATIVQPPQMVDKLLSIIFE